jgi:putative ABC transport system substrate-binding protein
MSDRISPRLDLEFFNRIGKADIKNALGARCDASDPTSAAFGQSYALVMKHRFAEVERLVSTPVGFEAYTHQDSPGGCMSRRDFVVLLCVTALALPQIARSQLVQPKVARIGFLSGQTVAGEAATLEALRQGLREQGYIDGQNIAIEIRYAEANVQRLPSLAQDLTKLKVDVLVAAGNLSAMAAKAATADIPIVFWAVADPVGQGFAASIARPGGNMTGFMDYRAALTTKRLELLKEALPRARRVAVLTNAASPANNISALKEAESATRDLGLRLSVLAVGKPEEFENAFQAAVNDHADAVYVIPDPLFRSNRARLTAAAMRTRIPWMGWAKEFAEDGALLSYGVNFPDVSRQTARYVAKILKGARPGDLPIEQPSKIELVINLGVAKALGIKVSPSFVIRADYLIH